DLHSLDPVQQGRRCAAYLGRNRLDRRPQRPVLVTMLLNQTHRTLTHFRGKFVVLAHGSILSRIEASSKPGVIHLMLIIYHFTEPWIKQDSPLRGTLLIVTKFASFNRESHTIVKRAVA